MGLAQGCTLLTDIAKDQALTMNDVSLPVQRLSDALRLEQNEYFFGEVSTS